MNAHLDRLPSIDASDSAAHGFTLLTRLGFAAKGVVYLLAGLLAIFWAMGRRDGAADRGDVIRTIYDQPFGQVLLVVIALGFFGYALYKFVAAALDLEDQGAGVKGIATRIGYAVVGVSYTLLGIAALGLVLGTGNGGRGSDASAQDWTARLLAQPFGVVLVVALGLIVLGVAANFFYRAWTTKFEKKLDLGDLDRDGRRLCVRIGQFGLTAQGLVLAIIGIFFIVAAVRHDPGQARGLTGALAELAGQPYGGLLLGVVALGLMAFGIYSLIEARYRRIRRPDPEHIGRAVGNLARR